MEWTSVPFVSVHRQYNPQKCYQMWDELEVTANFIAVFNQDFNQDLHRARSKEFASFVRCLILDSCFQLLDGAAFQRYDENWHGIILINVGFKERWKNGLEKIDGMTNTFFLLMLRLQHYIFSYT